MRPLRCLAIVLASLALTSGGTWAAEAGLGTLHAFKDWVVGCDNTRRCEAQGYGAEGDGAPAGGRAALIVRRDAGPGQMPQLFVAFSSFDESDRSRSALAGRPIQLQVGALRVALPPQARDETPVPVPATQVPAVIAAVLRAEQLSLTIARAQWWVSLAGAHAALLKMDDLQRRVGTPGALVRRGAAAEPEAPAWPTVEALRLPPTSEADRRLAPTITRALPRSAEACPGFEERQIEVDIVRLSASELLVAQACFPGAYQTGSRLLRVSDQPPFRATPVPLPQPDGSLADVLILEHLGNEGGVLALQESAKARGIGDCWATREWTWTSRGLALVDAGESPCRAFEAGGLPISLWRSKRR